MRKEELVRRTKSACPDCFETIEGAVIEKEGKIFLQKNCPVHGVSELFLSSSPFYYRSLDSFYFALMDRDKLMHDVELYVTFDCNMACPLCYLGSLPKDAPAGELTCMAIEQYASVSGKTSFMITGGEPTCRSDLPKIIRILKRHDKSVSLNTNGIRLADFDYLYSLKEAGLDRVNLQLDGFSDSIVRQLRNHDYFAVKMICLEHLRRLDISTGINVVIVKGINENNLKDFIDFAAQNNFINSVIFITITKIGNARNFPIEKYIMPDELVDLLEEQTAGKISRHNVYLFQKLHIAIKSFLKQRFCFYSQVYVAVRRGSGYEPIDRFLNFPKMEPWLDRYRSAFQKNRILASLYLGLAIMVLFANRKSLLIIKDLILTSISYFFKSESYLKSRRFFYINFTTGCGPLKIDYDIARNCHNELVYIDSDTGQMREPVRSSYFYVQQEKEWLQKHRC